MIVYVYISLSHNRLDGGFTATFPNMTTDCHSHPTWDRRSLNVSRTRR